jgi:hypothetical protein
MAGNTSTSPIVCELADGERPANAPPKFRDERLELRTKSVRELRIADECAIRLLPFLHRALDRRRHERAD